MSRHKIVDEFIINNKKVIAIDERRTAEEFGVTNMLIDGVEYPFVLTHNDYWYVVDTLEPLLGKTVEFVSWGNVFSNVKEIEKAYCDAHELIAQSFGNYYYGDKKSRIAKAIVEYFMKELS